MPVGGKIDCAVPENDGAEQPIVEGTFVAVVLTFGVTYAELAVMLNKFGAITLVSDVIVPDTFTFPVTSNASVGVMLLIPVTRLEPFEVV